MAREERNFDQNSTNSKPLTKQFSRMVAPTLTLLLPKSSSKYQQQVLFSSHSDPRTHTKDSESSLSQRTSRLYVEFPIKIVLNLRRSSDVFQGRSVLPSVKLIENKNEVCKSRKEKCCTVDTFLLEVYPGQISFTNISIK